MKKKINFIFICTIIFIIFFSLNNFFINKKIENLHSKNAIFNIYSQNNIKIENTLGLNGETEKYKNISEEHIIGKGFFIKKSGVFLTAKHIFENKKSKYFVKINNKKYNIEILKIYENRDKVLGQIDYKNSNLLRIKYTKHDSLIYENQDIYTIKNNKKNLGNILKLNQKLENLNLNNLIKTNIELGPGDSGTPVFNYSTNTVIGIFVAIKKGEKISFFEKL